MRFPVAWAGIASQNVSLKVSTLLLAFTTVILGICLSRFALKPALVIERGCHSKVIPLASPERTEQEIQNFLRKAIAQRFDSDYLGNRSYLSSAEQATREKERVELDQGNMKQRVIVNDVKLKEGQAMIDTDRLISVGKIRSAFRFSLIAILESVPQTESNPYGLVLTSVEQSKSDEGEKP